MSCATRSRAVAGQLVAIIDRLAPKPVKPLPKWVEELASTLDGKGLIGLASELRYGARKAMEDGNE
jgi:hypothetical protein